MGRILRDVSETGLGIALSGRYRQDNDPCRITSRRVSATKYWKCSPGGLLHPWQHTTRVSGATETGSCIVVPSVNYNGDWVWSALTEYSAVVWLKITGPLRADYAWAMYEGGAAIYYDVASSNAWRFGFADTSFTYTTSTAYAEVGKTICLALTWKGNGNLYGYANGVQVANRAAGSATSSHISSFTFGNYSESLTYGITGLLGPILVFARELKPTEVELLARQPDGVFPISTTSQFYIRREVDSATVVEASSATIAVTAPAISLTLGALTLTADVVTATATAPDLQLVVSTTVSASEQSVTVTAPESTVSVGALTLTLATTTATATAPGVTVTLGGITVAAGEQTATVTAPTAEAVFGGTIELATGTQTATVTAPTISVTLGALTVAVDTNTATVTAPATAFTFGTVTLVTGTQTTTVTAPVTAFTFGTVTLVAGEQTATVTAPTTAFTFGTVTLVTGTQTTTVTAPETAFTFGTATIVVGEQTATVTAPTTAFTFGTVTLASGAQTTTVSAPEATTTLALTCVLDPSVVTVTAPTADVLSGTTITLVGTIVGGTIELTWNLVAGGTAYSVQRRIHVA